MRNVDVSCSGCETLKQVKTPGALHKIVHADLDTIILPVNNGGQRGTTLTPILRRDLAGTTDVVEETLQTERQRRFFGRD